MSAVIYIEGGGDGDHSLERLFRRSWTAFFAAWGLRGRMPRVVRGGARNHTFDLFARSIKNPIPKRVPLLLVDSEDAIHADHSVWQRLHARDGLHQPPGAHEDQAVLMVHLMETWFLADRQSLKGYFGAGFTENKIRQWPRLEDVPKADGPQFSPGSYCQM